MRVQRLSASLSHGSFSGSARYGGGTRGRPTKSTTHLRLRLRRGITHAAVAAAARRLSAHLPVTPLLESVVLNELVGGRVLVKAECLQLTSTFKVRGAMNRVLCLEGGARDAGVVAFSSGNFGQGLAYAASALGTRATIVMPADSPLQKRERAESYGGRIVLSPLEDGVNREVTAARVAAELAEAESLTLLHPFEDADVIAGQGTVALEIAQQAAALPARNVGSEEGAPPSVAAVGTRVASLSALYVCCGGGGLTAGCAAVMASADALCRVVPVEPVGFDGFGRSLRAGRIVAVGVDEPQRSRLCDALQAPAPGTRAWATVAAAGNISGGAVVSDADVRSAMAVAFDALRVVLEPSGAVGIAALLSASRDPGQRRALGLGEWARADRAVAVVASGGNVSYEKHAAVLRRC